VNHDVDLVPKESPPSLQHQVKSETACRLRYSLNSEEDCNRVVLGSKLLHWFKKVVAAGAMIQISYIVSIEKRSLHDEVPQIRVAGP